MSDDGITIIRRDRVAMYSLNGAYNTFVARLPWPLLSPCYGDMWLTDNGTGRFHEDQPLR